MNDTALARTTIPTILHCESGRWLAISPPHDTLPCIGVLGETEEVARAKFRESLADWIQNLNS